MENVPQNKPIIFAANHQNTFIDATLLAYRLKKSVYILVRSDVFKGRFLTLLLKALHLIPIYRKQDQGSNIKNSNDKTLQHCASILKKNKAILIFPEGQSKAAHQLSPFKKGMARMALSTQNINNFDLDLMLVPVYIHYEHHFFAKNDVTIEFLSPMETKLLKFDYQNNPAKTIQSLTQNTEEAIRAKLLCYKHHSTTREVSTNNTLFPVAKFLFFPTIKLSSYFYKLVQDKDFFLSIISFSWLLLGSAQIIILCLLAYLFFSWKASLILLIGLIFTAKYLLKHGESISEETFNHE